MEWHHATGTLPLTAPRVVGVVNLTPDSFSDGGRLRTLDDARRHADALVGEGADVLDLGGESTRPGAVPVGVEEELRRVIPAVSRLAADHPTVPISIDTVKARVADEALAAGASIVNDVSAGRLDPDMAATCARWGAGMILMHSRGDVSDMAAFDHAVYGDDPVGEIMAELEGAVDRATRAGVPRGRIVLDPGIGFGKRAEQSLLVLRELRRLAAMGFPVLVGVSRKRFIGQITRSTVPADRAAGTIGANVAALMNGARLFRVHDVRPNREALDVAWAVMRTSGDE